MRCHPHGTTRIYSERVGFATMGSVEILRFGLRVSVLGLGSYAKVQGLAFVEG